MHDYKTVSVAVDSLRDKMVVGMMGMSTHFSVVLSGVSSSMVVSDKRISGEMRTTFGVNLLPSKDVVLKAYKSVALVGDGRSMSGVNVSLAVDLKVVENYCNAVKSMIERCDKAVGINVELVYFKVNGDYGVQSRGVASVIMGVVYYVEG